MLKAHYSRFLKGLGGRLHFAAHSHHLWPDVTRQAVLDCWDDAARLADGKWERIFGAIVPEAQAHVARSLGLSSPRNVVFGANTHELAWRLASCLDWAEPVRIVTTDAEFHSFSRQLRRLEELKNVSVVRVKSEPFGTFEARFAAAARERCDLVYLSQVFFDSAFAVGDMAAIARAAHPRAIVAIDGYHAFCAVPTDLGPIERRVFYLAGGYKYAQSGEGAAFMTVPPGCALRPRNTGWLSDYHGLAGEQPERVRYGAGALRFWGATFDPSGLYRFNAVMRWMRSLRLTIPKIHRHVAGLQASFLERLDALNRSDLNRACLVTPLHLPNQGHFLAFRVKGAAGLARRLKRAGVDVDFRGDRVRFGFGLYHSKQDVAALAAAIEKA